MLKKIAAGVSHTLVDSEVVNLVKGFKVKTQITRMHSSRMRTGRSLTVCRSLLPGGGVSPLGG